MSLPIFYSLIFFIVSTSFILLGLHILFLNTKGALNRVFFVFCLSLFIWAFSFSISNSLTDYESVLFWRRWTSLGWGFMFSLQLHFFLILTERKHLLHKKWFYLLLF